VRLAGESHSKGRLEVYHSGSWGTVCDNGFTDAAARVVCYSLGYGRTGRFVGNVYGAGSGQIWLENVHCSGWETDITRCRHSGWGRQNCEHSDDVSISCLADSAAAVALVGGGNPRFGRLEVFYANHWGTVCDDGFTDAAARVLCYSLGFGYVGNKDINHYGAGGGLIWLNNVKCTGTERHIGECSKDWRVHNCTHQQDVAVTCTGNTSVANDGTSVTPVRLAVGTGSTGRLEILHDGIWGTVCEDHFTAAAARLVCKMLGLESGSKIDNSDYRIDHGTIWLDDVRCNGTETDITECSHRGWGIHDCQHHEDVAISCNGTKAEVRLNGGRSSREGRLEVFFDGTWRSICRDGFNDAAAKVVCYMLGIGYIGRPITNTYGYDYGPYWVNSVQCTGTESNLAKCSNNGWSVGYCGRHEEQAITAVTCLTNNAVELFGGTSPREGRLEIYHNGSWGTVCDDGFTNAAARVVCYSLGFGYAGWETSVVMYGTGKGDIWMDDINCKGTEKHIDECSHRGWGVYDCTHSEDAAVYCTKDPPVVTMITLQTTTVQSTESSQIRTYVIIAGVALAVILLISCGIYIGRTCCRKQERREQNTLPMHETPSNMNRPQPTAPAFQPTGHAVPTTGHPVQSAAPAFQPNGHAVPTTGHAVPNYPPPAYSPHP